MSDTFYLIDQFTVSSGIVSITYDPNSQTLTAQYPGGFDDLEVNASNRGRNPGDYITTRGAVNFYASLQAPYVTTSIQPDDGGGTTTTPNCDLIINAVTVLTHGNEYSSNGSVTVSATSSHAPIQYSSDNLNWQSSSTLTGLPGGGGTAYAKDALGCLSNTNFFIPIDLPLPALVSSPALGSSRWSALFNPIVFGYQSPTQAPGRKFITEVTSGYDGAANVITATHTSNLTGYCRADISKYLRTLLQPADNLDYTAINYRDANISASYTVRYKEVWSGGDSGWISAGDPYYVTYSAMQIGNKTSGNMQPYVTLPDANQTNPAKFLNDFKNPILYTDLPFDISFIYSEKVLGYQLKLGGNGIDINGNICGSLGELMLLNENGSVLLNEDGSKLLIEKQAPGVLVSKLGVNRLQVHQNIPAASQWLDVFLFYTDASGNNIPVTESRRLLLDNSPCNGLPYEYLKWMGPSGGWLYYLFIKNQLHELQTANTVLMDRYIDDYATADSTQNLVSINAQKRITAGKNDIPATEAETLATLLYSPKVYRLIDATSNTWQGVIIDTKSLKMYQTEGQLGDFEISYLLPEVNVQVG